MTLICVILLSQFYGLPLYLSLSLALCLWLSLCNPAIYLLSPPDKRNQEKHTPSVGGLEGWEGGVIRLRKLAGQLIWITGATQHRNSERL